MEGTRLHDRQNAPTAALRRKYQRCNRCHQRRAVRPRKCQLLHVPTLRQCASHPMPLFSGKTTARRCVARMSSQPVSPFCWRNGISFPGGAADSSRFGPRRDFCETACLRRSLQKPLGRIVNSVDTSRRCIRRIFDIYTCQSDFISISFTK